MKVCLSFYTLLYYRKIEFSCLFLVFPLFFLFLHFEHEPWNLKPETCNLKPVTLCLPSLVAKSILD